MALEEKAFENIVVARISPFPTMSSTLLKAEVIVLATFNCRLKML